MVGDAADPEDLKTKTKELQEASWKVTHEVVPLCTKWFLYGVRGMFAISGIVLVVMACIIDDQLL